MWRLGGGGRFWRRRGGGSCRLLVFRVIRVEFRLGVWLE